MRLPLVFSFFRASFLLLTSQLRVFPLHVFLSLLLCHFLFALDSFASAFQGNSAVVRFEEMKNCKYVRVTCNHRIFEYMEAKIRQPVSERRRKGKHINRVRRARLTGWLVRVCVNVIAYTSIFI